MIETFGKLLLGQICPAGSKHTVLQGDATSVYFFQFFPYKDEKEKTPQYTQCEYI